MKPFAWQIIDRIAILAAASRMAQPDGRDLHVAEALRLLERPEVYPDEVKPITMEFDGAGEFRFDSPRPSAHPVNNIARGRFYRCDSQWQKYPAVLLLHGWNDLLNHRYLFPKNARRLNELGMNAATLQLPWHFGRRPAELGAWGNFLSADILRTLEAALQALSEIHALVDWLLAQGCPSVGLWGISMGAWLSGLSICNNPRISYAALTVPVARLDKLINGVAFCRTIRSTLEGHDVDLRKLSLGSACPVIDKKNILLVEAEHDLFVDKEDIEELWRAWGRPEIFRLPYAHISVLWAKDYARRVEHWIAARAGVLK
jgi:dienelactone hydrolase